jgi:uncharacterized protein Yka (UPF0111/DUF47 family)
MITKRIKIKEKTLQKLEAIYEPLHDRPRSIEQFEAALEYVIDHYYENAEKIVKLDKRLEKKIEGLVEYGIAESRSEFITKAVRESVKAMMPELEAKIEEEIVSKRKAFGLA